MAEIIEMKGQRYGRLLVLSKAKAEPNQHTRWNCACDCGKQISIVGKSLRSGVTTSCGCFHQELRRLSIKHGQARKTGCTDEYRAWCAMKRRCYNEKDASFERYGGNGIVVCDEWLGERGFDNFYKDMGKRPSAKHSLDRINGMKGYFKDNCRWASRLVQSINKKVSKANVTGVKGVQFVKATGRYKAAIKIFGKEKSLGLFSTLEEAISVRKLAEEKYHKPILDAA